MQITLRQKLYCFIFFMFCFFTPIRVHAETKTVYDYDAAGNMVSQITTDVILDNDGDGISNADEIANGTDPDNSDTDGDGMPDGWEVANGLDPLYNDANGDADYDGVSNYDEYLAGTTPNEGIRTDLVLSYETITTGQVEDYRTANSITAGPAYIVESGANVSCKAGSIITLKPGFSANGPGFDAVIE